jgi:hypothetical protein
MLHEEVELTEVIHQNWRMHEDASYLEIDRDTTKESKS